MSGTTFGKNISALKVQRSLNDSTARIGSTFERLSSGLRINKASDDAASLAVSKVLKARSDIYEQGLRNINDGVSYLNVAESAAAELTGILTRQKELAQQAANGSLGLSQRQALQAEADALTNEFNRIVGQTKFNDREIFSTEGGQIRFQGGFGVESSIEVSIQSALSRSIGNLEFNSGNVVDQTASFSERSIISGDFNGDGYDDLISDQNEAFEIYYGSQSASLTGGASTLGATSIAAAGDFDGDGDLDVVEYGSAGRILLNDGSGNFSDSGYTADTRGIIGIADFDGDGILDIAGTQAVSFGDGDGNFSTTVATGITGDFVVSDYDGDGVSEIISGGNDLIYQVSRAGVSTDSTSITGVVYSSADFNNDGLEDILTEDELLLSNGDGSFSVSASFGDTVAVTTIIDANNDGLLDVVFTSDSGAELRLFTNNGDGSFTGQQTFASFSNSTYALTSGDFNGDGIEDIGAMTYDGASNAEIGFLTQNSEASYSTQFFNISNAAEARSSLNNIETELQRLSQGRAALGASISRLEVASANLAASGSELEAAYQRITQSDVAQDVAELTKEQILQQSSAALLAQANQQPQIALQVLQGAPPSS